MHATHKLIKVKRNFQRQTDTRRDTSSGIKRSRKKKRKQKQKTGKNRDRKNVPEKQRDLETASEACSEIDSFGGSRIHILLLQWEFQNLQCDIEFAYWG